MKGSEYRRIPCRKYHATFRAMARSDIRLAGDRILAIDPVAPDRGLPITHDRFVVPVTRVVERRVTPPFGQSVLGVAVVPG